MLETVNPIFRIERVFMTDLSKADGKRFGNLEMDTIVGSNNQQAIVTLVDRSTNMLFMKKLKYGKDAKK